MSDFQAIADPKAVNKAEAKEDGDHDR